MDIDLSYRTETPQWIVLSTPILTVLAALAVGALIIGAVGENPLDVYYHLFVGPLSQTSRIIEILVRATPIILAGLSVYLPLRAGLWNVGAEGQIYIGGIAAAWVALSTNLGPVSMLPVMFLAAVVAGGVWGLIPGYFRARWGTNEIVTTLMFTFIAIQFNEYVIRGPLQGTPGFPTSGDFPPAAQLPTVGETQITAGIVVVGIAVLCVYILMSKLSIGYQIAVVGSDSTVGEQTFEVARVVVLTMLIGGALSGLAGMLMVAGPQGGRLQSGFSPGYGFTAIPIALLGKNGAFRVALAGLFFALLFVGGNVISTRTGLPTTIIDVIQALIILFIITSEFFKRFSVDFHFGTKEAV